MSNLEFHAENELRAIAPKPGQDCTYHNMIVADVMELIKVFAAQEHSGSSAPLVTRLFSKLAMFEPLAPLTGADDEWVEVSKDLWQNKRCSHVFKDLERAYDINGIIFEDSDGTRVTNKDSHTTVTFPYTPESRVVRRFGGR